MEKRYSSEVNELPLQEKVDFKKNPWEPGLVKMLKKENKTERVKVYGKNYKKYFNKPEISKEILKKLGYENEL